MTVPASKTRFERGRKVGILQATGSIMAIIYAELGLEVYEQIKDEVIEWAEAQTGIRVPSVEEL